MAEVFNFPGRGRPPMMALPAIGSLGVTLPLQRGATGAGVMELQRRLSAAGYNIGPSGVDGDFGPDTEAAVQAYQMTALGAPMATGVVDQATWNALVAATPSVPSASPSTGTGPRTTVSVSPSGLVQWFSALPLWQKALLITGGLAAASLLIGTVRMALAGMNDERPDFGKLLERGKCKYGPPSEAVLDEKGKVLKD